MTPRHPEYMIATFFVVIVGLSLVSVCINVAQEKFSQVILNKIKKQRTSSLKRESSDLHGTAGQDVAPVLGSSRSW